MPAAERLRRVVGAAVHRLRPDVEVAVELLITGDGRLQELNRGWRGLDRPTDVLSFPDGDLLPDGTEMLGQIAISLDTARRQADDLGHDEVRELEELALHGVLHLAGFDHEADGGEMDRLELALRRELLP